MNRLAKYAAAGVAALSLSVVALDGAPVHANMKSVESTAPAVSPDGRVSPDAQIRSGARWNQMDVLMSRQETSSVARGVVGGAKICWPLIAGGAALGAKMGGPLGAIIGTFLAGGSCIIAVTTCATRAFQRKRNAGMTVQVGLTGVSWWCWDY